jgi:hypothetical protein
MASLAEQHHVFQVTSLGSNVQGCVTVIVDFLQRKIAFNQHSEDLFKPGVFGRHMEHIIAELIGIHNVNASLSQHFHDRPIAADACNPERIEALRVALIDIDHLVLQHQADELLAGKS